jgi:tetratricopeptide (TPR) repeat protein
MQVIRIFTLLFILLLSGCSGISIISGQNSEDLYTKQFLISIGKIKGRYGAGDKKGALAKLKLLKEENLLPSEKALRRNLIGVIKFSTGEYEQAIFNFDIALATSGLDEALTSQVYMNLASSYYKLQQMEKAYSALKLIQEESLRKNDKKKYYELKLMISKELGQHRDALLALII